MLMCGTGKVLDIDGSFNAGGETSVLAKDPNGGESQQFYPLKIISPMIPDKEFSFIGRLTEKIARRTIGANGFYYFLLVVTSSIYYYV